jgi:hypothetical protein
MELNVGRLHVGFKEAYRRCSLSLEPHVTDCDSWALEVFSSQAEHKMVFLSSLWIQFFVIKYGPRLLVL